LKYAAHERKMCCLLWDSRLECLFGAFLYLCVCLCRCVYVSVDHCKIRLGNTTGEWLSVAAHFQLNVQRDSVSSRICVGSSFLTKHKWFLLEWQITLTGTGEAWEEMHLIKLMWRCSYSNKTPPKARNVRLGVDELKNKWALMMDTLPFKGLPS